MMKSIPLVVILLVAMTPITNAVAETDATAIDTLTVDLWPDYDKASVLVLLTGTLPADTPLPVRVTLPFPETAHLNAVARIDARDGQMKDDILSSPGPGELSFITPDLSFRLEYYQPYTVKDKERSFDFTWRADVSVARFRVKVQRPSAAVTFRTVPSTTDILRDEYGLIYHLFPVRSLPAGHTLTVHVDYTVNQPRLSLSDRTPQAPEVPSAAEPVKSLPNSGVDWPFLLLVAGGGLMLLAAIWLVVTRRSGRSS